MCEVNRERSHLSAASSMCDSTKHNGLVTIEFLKGCTTGIEIPRTFWYSNGREQFCLTTGSFNFECHTKSRP